MGARQEPEARTLESGNIYFLYRPRVHSPDEKVEVRGPEDIERTYIVLSVRGEHLYRLIVVGRKRLPAVERGHERFWGFVDIVSRRPEDVEDELDRKVYETSTRGERVLPAARPAGEGVYRLVQHGNHNHLAYALELPKKPGPVQEELHIEEEASYIVSVKNPEAPSPPGLGLSRREKPELPPPLQEKFRGRRFIPADPELLNYEGVELMFIAASEDPREELGIELHPQSENEWNADIFKDLRLERSQHPLEPLFSGKWK